MAAVAVAVAVAVAATEGGGSTIDLLNGGGADHLCAATVLTGVVLESVIMDRLTEEDDDGGAEGGSSGTSLEQHGGVSADQVTMEIRRPTLIRRKGSRLLDPRCRDQQARAGKAGNSRSPRVQQQSSLTPMAPHVFELMLQQAAEQGPWPEAPSGNGRRRNRNRTKRKKALAAAAARRAARDSALCLLASRCMQGGDVAKDPARSLAEKGRRCFFTNQLVDGSGTALPWERQAPGGTGGRRTP
eukprot:jgi/Undpi1/10625/HiC_scaffold_29.g13075.m1